MMLVLATACTAWCDASARERIRLDRDWAFTRGDATGAEAPGFDASTWRRLDLPHDWSIELPTDAAAPARGAGGFFPTGIGWYRHVLPTANAWQGRRVSIEFEGVYERAEVWINGVRLGEHHYGYTPFYFDLTPHLRADVENVLAVRVDNSRQPNSRWYSGSGIYRHVWLHVTDPVHVSWPGLFVTTDALSAEIARIAVETTIQNDTASPQEIQVETALRDPAGRRAGTDRTTTRVEAKGRVVIRPLLEVKRPLTWSPAAPRLYRATTRLAIGGREVDQQDVSFGIRTVCVSAARGFELNGQALELVGANVHHDHGVLGAASFDRAEERKVELLRAAGFNALRTAHNPPSTAFLTACDRHGMLVIDEAFDGWERSKMPQDYGRAFKEWSLRDLEAFVVRDRNHPSVVMWSIGNEVYERGSASGTRIAQALAEGVRALDPSRPVTIGLNGFGEKGDWTRLDPIFALMDVTGYNYELARHAADHARLPERVIFSSESYLNETFANWVMVRDHAHVIGDFVWTGMDYLGEAGIGRIFPPGEPVVRHWEGIQFPWRGAVCGDLDLIGARKPVSHYRNIVWDRGEKLYAAVLVPSPDGRPWNVSPWGIAPARPSWTWPGNEGRPLTVEVYSRHEAVRLELNGKVIGEQPTTRAEQFKATFAVSFAPGELKVVGLWNGRRAETFVLRSAGEPRQLRLSVDRSRLSADGQELAFVTIEAVDRHGVVVPDARARVRVMVNGEGTLAGLGSADLTREFYRENPVPLFDGRALAVVRAGANSGKIDVVVTASGLPDARVGLDVAKAR